MDKGEEMTSNNSLISTKVLEVTTELGNTLSHSKELLRFKIAEERLETDEKAQSLLTEFSELQQKTRVDQLAGIFSESSIKRLRELQNSFTEFESIQEYQISNELAVNFLREVNLEISQFLGIDFASLTRISNASC